MVAATKTVPEHYDVRGKISSNISFAFELPTDWNGKFYMVGNGVYAGNIEYTAMENGLRQGYATASTDTGHDARLDPLGSIGASFAYNNPQAVIDYGYRAVHLTAVTAKEIIGTYYGKQPSYSYFVSCSTGGRQGLMEAQRYPLDFNGIVVGDPVLNFTGIVMWGIWNARALSGADSITADKLKILADAVYAKCDGVDGLVDGLINDPSKCTFDPATDLPSGSFTPAQVEALKKIYGGVRNSKNELLFPGAPIGAEVFAGGMSGWDMWMFGMMGNSSLQQMISEQFLKYMAFETGPDPGYDWTTFNFDTDPPKMAHISSIIDATNPDLSEFKAHGGKIIHYHGWADMALTPFMSVDYYKSVLSFMGVDKTMDFYRLYMVPGMFHCAGGVGCDIVDWFTPLVTWVENGIAPEGLVGSHIEGGKVVRTRPLYPYPEVAVYTGSGSIDDAVNFTCSGCQELPKTTKPVSAVLYGESPYYRLARKGIIFR
jgi:feruloyl esterase